MNYIDNTPFIPPDDDCWGDDSDDCCETCGGDDWVIVGGESGPGARPCEIDWIRQIISQCRAAAVPCFVKQLGERVVANEPLGQWPAYARWIADESMLGFRCYGLTSKKGGDWDEWPEEFRIRQYPENTPCAT